MHSMIRFDTGGYVIHKITGDFRGHVSAWFAADGTLLDAERHTHVCGSPRALWQVKPNGPIWHYVANIGKPYAIRETVPA